MFSPYAIIPRGDLKRTKLFYNSKPTHSSIVIVENHPNDISFLLANDKLLFFTFVSIDPKRSPSTSWQRRADISSSVSCLKQAALNNVRVNTGGGVKIPSASSGGGGSSSSSSSKTQTDTEKLLNRIGDADDYEDARRAIMQLQQAYHAAKDESQGVLHYMQQEYELVRALPGVYRQNMKDIAALLETKKRELAATSTSAENYESLAGEVRDLEAAYSDYQKKIIEVETDLIDLTKAMEEQRNAVRDTTIEIQDLINQAIEDRNAREQDALEARIDMEETIIAALQKRYDAEKTMQQEALNARKAALQEEKQALNDALNERKRIKEEQSKTEQLALMEANYAVISRDSTRTKEAASLFKDIQALREEIAEDTLSKQIEQQQKLIDEQITAIENELAGLDETYANRTTPADLATEITELLNKTDAEIIEWLKANNEDFAASTEAMQQSMISSWQDTLNTMHGIQETNWAEVAEIMAGGQQAIIDFLRENTDEYRQASHEQASAYEQEWMDTLNRLNAQMLAFQNTVTATSSAVLQPTVIAPSTYSGSSSSGSSGGSSGSSSKSSGGGSSSSSSSNTSNTSLAALLAGTAGAIAGAVAAATVSSGVGKVVASATSAVAGLVASTVNPVSSITNTISNLFGGNTTSSSKTSTTTNNVNVNVNASTVKSTAQAIKQTVSKNRMTMTIM